MRSLFKKFLNFQIFMVLMVSQIGFCAGVEDDAFDRMENGDIIHSLSTSETASPKRLSWTDVAALPVHFVASLVQPFTDLACATTSSFRARLSSAKHMSLMDCLERGEGVEDFQYGAVQKAQDVVTQLAGDVKGSAKSVGVAIKEKPLDAACTGLGLAVSWTGIGEIAPAATTAVVGVVNLVRNGKELIYSSAKSIEGDKVVTKLFQVGMCVGAAYVVVTAVASLPVAAALDWNSLADAKAHYDHGSCYDNSKFGKDWREIMPPVSECLRGGGSLESCQTQIPGVHQAFTVDRDLYAFTRHTSDKPELSPVSIVQLESQRTCFLTALDTHSPVTKTCFLSLSDLDTRTVEVVSGLTLLRAHEGLEAGQSVRHVGLRLQSGFGTQAACGHFSEASAKYDLGSKPVCLLTALTPGGDVTQMCFDPKNPETLTIKPIEGISLDFKDNGGQPVSIIIKDPSKFGLNVKSVDNPTPPSAPVIKEGQRVCEGDKCYEYQKVEVPCEKKDEL